MPPEFLGGGEHFALEVRGDSMIEAGISGERHGHHPQAGHRRDRRYRRCADRRGGGDAQAVAQARRLDCARGRQSGLRDPDFRPGPGPGPGEDGQSVAPLLTDNRPAEGGRQSASCRGSPQDRVLAGQPCRSRGMRRNPAPAGRLLHRSRRRTEETIAGAAAARNNKRSIQFNLIVFTSTNLS